MAKTQIDDERKENEYRDLMQLSQYSPLVKIRALDSGRGHPPTQYEIVYTCRGYAQPGVVRDRFLVRMTLPAGYPRVLPDFRCVDPPTIYHPHIFGDGWICIGHEHGMPVGLQLREYVTGVGEMIQWRKDTEGRSGPVDQRSLVGAEPEPERPQQPAASPVLSPRSPRPEEDFTILVQDEQPTDIEVEIGPSEPARQPSNMGEKKEEASREVIVIEVADEKDESDRGPIVIEVRDE